MRPAVATALALLALGLGLGACGSDDPGATSTAAAPSSGGATAPAETSPGTTTATPAADGAQVAADNGCQACHQLPAGGAPGPGPDLRAIGAQLDAAAIERTLVEGPGSMPSFAKLRDDDPEQFRALVAYLAGLR